jgi:hypothetical protein
MILLFAAIFGCGSYYSGGDTPIKMLIGLWAVELETEDGGTELKIIHISQSGRNLVICEKPYPSPATFSSFYSGETWFNKVSLNRHEIGIGLIDADYSTISAARFDPRGERYVTLISSLSGGDPDFAEKLHQYYGASDSWQILDGTYEHVSTDGSKNELGFLAYRLDKEPYRDYDTLAEEYIETEMQLCVDPTR